jgi:hypothetical protein
MEAQKDPKQPKQFWARRAMVEVPQLPFQIVLHSYSNKKKHETEIWTDMYINRTEHRTQK